MGQRRLRSLVVLVLALGSFLLWAAAAGAAVRTTRHAPRAGVRSNTELTWNTLGPGGSVHGFIADDFNPINSATEPYPSYPAGTPPLGFSAQDEGFAGIIVGEPKDGSPSVSLYCIDIRTNTYPGDGYALDTWSRANVPNVGYVARILDEYYPHTDKPAGLTENNKAAAVQAAIWYFTDGYVVNNSDQPVRDAVAAIVDTIQDEPPLVQPPPPSVNLAPPDRSGPAGSVIGPFTLTVNSRRHAHRRHRGVTDATVTATGATMYSDASGTTLLGDGSIADAVPSGQTIYLRSSGPSTAVLKATAQATVPTGNVYLYDGNGRPDGQKLILAETATLTSSVQATAEFQAPGSLTVTKTIAGDAAGSQGQVVIHVACSDGVARDDFVIPAGSAAGTKSRTYVGIPAGTVCGVFETSTGSTVGTEVVVTGDGREVTIPSGETKAVNVTDTYHFVGSLLVRKTIAGPAAGQQGPITIHAVCDGTALTPDFVIPAGTPAGDQTEQYDHIPAPATCTVTETADGHTGTVSVVVGGSGQTVSVPAGKVAEADISDTYGLVPGQLEVTKSIAGPLAGQQGTVVIHTVCNGTALSPDLVIAAGATGDRSQLYSGIPTPASCVVTETADGATGTVSVSVTGSPQTTTIPPGGAGAAHITDIYGSAPGSLLITKTIAGPFAGQQGPVAIHVVCDGTAISPDFVIASGTPAGNASQSFDGIPAGSACTVMETTDGATATVAAAVSGDDQNVTVPAGTVVPVNLIDVYERRPSLLPEVLPSGPVGSLKVTKTIAGSAARHHGRISILVACGGPIHTYAFLIPAHTGHGSVSRFYPEIPAGARCTVTETTDGHTATVSVVTTGKRKKATIHADRTTTVHLTDTYSPKPTVVPVTGLG